MRHKGEVAYKLCRFLLVAQTFTATDAARFTQLPEQAVHTALRRLIKEGIVELTDERRGSGRPGRPQAVYRVPQTDQVLSALEERVGAFQVDTSAQRPDRKPEQFRVNLVNDLLTRARGAQGQERADLLTEARSHIEIGRAEEALDPAGIDVVCAHLALLNAEVEGVAGRKTQAFRFLTQARDALKAAGALDGEALDRVARAQEQVTYDLLFQPRKLDLFDFRCDFQAKIKQHAEFANVTLRLPRIRAHPPKLPYGITFLTPAKRPPSLPWERESELHEWGEQQAYSFEDAASLLDASAPTPDAYDFVVGVPNHGGRPLVIVELQNDPSPTWENEGLFGSLSNQKKTAILLNEWGARVYE